MTAARERDRQRARKRERVRESDIKRASERARAKEIERESEKETEPARYIHRDRDSERATEGEQERVQRAPRLPTRLGGVRQLIPRILKWFRGGLVFKEQRRVYRSTLDSREIKKKKKVRWNFEIDPSVDNLQDPTIGHPYEYRAVQAGVLTIFGWLGYNTFRSFRFFELQP